MDRLLILLRFRTVYFIITDTDTDMIIPINIFKLGEVGGNLRSFLSAKHYRVTLCQQWHSVLISAGNGPINHICSHDRFFHSHLYFMAGDFALH